MKNFRVLVVDDKKTVLNAMKDWIEQKYKVSDEEYIVELIRLHVNVVEDERNYKISTETLKNLHEICDRPFHFMFVDFGFVKQGIKTLDEINRLKKLNPQSTVRELIDKIVLNPSHIVNQSIHENKLYHKIKKNFIDFDGNLYVYTYIPSKIEREYTPADVRKTVTNKHFPKANIKIIDSRKELFNNTKFEDKHDNEFYPFLITKYLSKIIHIEIAEFILKQTKEIRNKFKLIKKRNKIITLSAILPSIIAGIFIPSLFTSIENQNYVVAIAFLVLLVVIVLIFTLLPKYVENKT